MLLYVILKHLPKSKYDYIYQKSLSPIMNKITRFRAYQLGTPGSSFSYSVDDHFTLIEARLTPMSIRGISAELKLLIPISS